MLSARARTSRWRRAYGVEGGDEARTSLKVGPVLVAPRKLGLLEQTEDARALALPSGEATKVVRERDLQATQERRNGYISGGELADGEALRREERLDGLGGLHELLGVRVVDEHAELRGVELVGDGVDEETRLGAQDGVLGEDARLGEEVGDELDEDERLVELDAVGRGLVGWDLRATERDGGDLLGCVSASRRSAWSHSCGLTLPTGLTFGRYHSGLFWRSISYLVKLAFASASAISVCQSPVFSHARLGSRLESRTLCA